MGIRYVFTGEIVADGDQISGVFIKSAFWGPVSRLLDATGISRAQRVHESEKDCVETVACILRGNAIHGDVKDLDGYRQAWRQIRSKKKQLGLLLETNAIG